MARNLFISYDLYNPGQDYTSIIEKIKSLGNWAKVHKSVWYVNSSYTPQEALQKLRTVTDTNDSLIVIDASANEACWYNLSDEVAKHIKSNWSSTIRTN